jgi:lipopolysaccharide biosynthesis protein
MKILTSKFSGQTPTTPAKYCVFSHFDANDRVERHVLHYLEQLKLCGYEVLLVSTSRAISDASVQALSKVCHTVCLRENVGYDFGSFKAGIQLLKQQGARVGRLLVANDSVFGPFTDLQPILLAMEREDIDLCGLTDSHDHGYHLQSYFISYSARLYESAVFNDFWSSVDLISNTTDNFKQKIVHNYEVGGSQYFLQAGCSYSVAFPYRDVLDRVFQRTLRKLDESRRPDSDIVMQPGELVFNLNASHAYWDELIDLGMPFIKRELLTKNPTATDVSNWPQKIAASSLYDVSMVLEALINQDAIENVYPIDIGEALSVIQTLEDAVDVPINPALRKWINTGGVPAAVTFRFDEQFYLSSYPDVAAVVKAGDYPFGLAHFKRHGFPEGRKCAFKRVVKN